MMDAVVHFPHDWFILFYFIDTWPTRPVTLFTLSVVFIPLPCNLSCILFNLSTNFFLPFQVHPCFDFFSHPVSHFSFFNVRYHASHFTHPVNCLFHSIDYPARRSTFTNDTACYLYHNPATIYLSKTSQTMSLIIIIQRYSPFSQPCHLSLLSPVKSWTVHTRFKIHPTRLAL